MPVSGKESKAGIGECAVKAERISEIEEIVAVYRADKDRAPDLRKICFVQRTRRQRLDKPPHPPVLFTNALSHRSDEGTLFQKMLVACRASRRTRSGWCRAR